MSGLFKSFTALLACLVVVGCSATEAPAPEASPGEAGAAASAQPQASPGVAPGDEVDTDELLNTVSDAVDGVTTMTATVKMESIYKGEDQSSEYRYVVDYSDPDHLRGSMRNTGGGSEREVLIDGDTQLLRLGDDKWEDVSEDAGQSSQVLNPKDSFISVAPMKGHVSKTVFVGEDQVGDFAARHYEFLVDPEVFQISDGRDDIVVGYWLNGDNLPVKVVYSMENLATGVDKMDYEAVVESFGPVEIKMPDASEIK